MKRIITKEKLEYLFCFLTIILFLYTFSLTSSRYLGKIGADEEAIAIPVFTLSNNTQKYTLNEINVPGDEQEIEFAVSNTDKGITNDVLLNYTFEFSSETIPLTFELYEVVNGNENKIDVTNNKTEVLTMNYGTEITKNYKLKIIWDENENDYEYADKSATFKMELKAEQVV